MAHGFRLPQLRAVPSRPGHSPEVGRVAEAFPSAARYVIIGACRATGRRASPIRCATTCSGRRPRSSRTGTWSCPKRQGSAQTSTRTSWTTTAWHEVGLRMRTGTPKTHVPGGGRYLPRRYPLHAPQHASSRSERNRRISTLAASEATFAAWKPHSVPTTRGLHWKRSDVMGRFRCTPPTSES